MRYSIRWKITLQLVLAVTLCVVLCLALNRSILPKYYMYTKISSLNEAFDYIKSIFENAEPQTGDMVVKNEASAGEESVDLQENEKQNPGDDNKTQNDDAKKENGKYNGNAGIAINGEHDIRRLYARLSGISDDTLNKAEWYLEGKNIYVSLYLSYFRVYYTSSAREAERMDMTLQRYLIDYTMIKPEPELLKMKEDFEIYRTTGEDGTEYIDLIGMFGENYIIYLRTNFESIQESAAAANKLLTYIGIITVLAGAAGMYMLSKTFSKPIMEMSVIAKRMSDLDFDVVYPVTTKDEIGELGNSINTLSSKLHNTIIELKNANNELTSDINSKIQIDEMRKEFLSNVTHELKTPIALIMGYAEGLKENINDDEESREFYCDVIIDEAAKMNNMVKKLLSLNQIEFGKNQVNMDKFDINSLIKSVINSADILIKNNDITVIFKNEAPVYVWADEYMIEDVLTNYISNAINHIGLERVIEVRLTEKEDVVRISVFNTGECIPEEELDKVWIKFYKVDKARTREYGGSGIGLSIVKAIMDNHHKECGVINHGNGVEFWFELEKFN